MVFEELKTSHYLILDSFFWIKNLYLYKVSLYFQMHTKYKGLDYILSMRPLCALQPDLTNVTL